MPRKKKVLYKKTIHLFVPKDKKMSTHSKHVLINTFSHLFQLRADKAANLLTESFKNAGVDESFPKRSAYSSYKKNNKLNGIVRLSNQGKVALTIEANSIKEGNRSKNDNFIWIKIPVLVDTLIFPPWHKRNYLFIKSLGKFITTERKYERRSYGLLMSAIQQVAPQPEKELIEPTIAFFKKQFGKPELEKTKKANPLRAKLIIIQNDDENQHGDSFLSSIYLLIQPSQSIGYIPFKLGTPDRSENIHDFLYEDQKNKGNKKYRPSTYSVYATKQDNQVQVELIVSCDRSITYQATIEEPKAWGKSSFNHSVFLDSKRSDGKYTIISKGKLRDCIVPFSAPNGGCEKASIEQALTRIHSTLSLFDFKPNMLIHRSGAHKIKPLILN